MRRQLGGLNMPVVTSYAFNNYFLSESLNQLLPCVLLIHMLSFIIPIRREVPWQCGSALIL